MAFGITAHDGVLWVTGANETLVRFDDKGHTWNLLHFKMDRANRISGEVLLHVVVGKNGRMKSVTLLAAPSSSLADSAMQTVRGWVYDPTLLSGHAVEVDTQIVVHYQLIR